MSYFRDSYITTYKFFFHKPINRSEIQWYKHCHVVSSIYHRTSNTNLIRHRLQKYSHILICLMLKNKAICYHIINYNFTRNLDNIACKNYSLIENLYRIKFTTQAQQLQTSINLLCFQCKQEL